MEEPPHLQELLDGLQCNSCASACPTLGGTGPRSRSLEGLVHGLERMAAPAPSGRVRKGQAPEIDQQWVRLLYLCTDCGRCAQDCPSGLDLSVVLAELRAWLARNDVPQPPAHQAMVSAIGGSRNRYGAPPAARSEWLGSVRTRQRADVVFFAGCVMSYDQIQLARSTVNVLRKAGVDFTVLGPDEWCCGQPLLQAGEESLFCQLAAHNLAAIERTGAVQLVTGCPGCYLTLKKTYPSRGFRPKCEVLHSSELVARLFDRGKLGFVRSPFAGWKGREKAANAVAYHDPCALGRKCGIFEPPRRILESLPGVGRPLEFVENMAGSACCGGGGALRTVDEEMCLRLGEKRLAGALELGAGMLVSTCPSCRVNLGDAARALKAREEKVKLEVRDLVELVARAI
jgi:heterodisulfide reductase subunit D